MLLAGIERDEPGPITDDGAVFEVAIGPGRITGTFRVDVISSPAGLASAAVIVDTGGWRRELQNAVLTSSVSARRIRRGAERPAREAGDALFTALLGTGEVAGQYRASAAVAASRDQALRVVLRIDAPDLAGLPWEAMYDQAAGGYLCLHGQLVRHIPVPVPAAPVAVRTPMRILGVISSPRGLPPLDINKERSLLAGALAGPAAAFSPDGTMIATASKDWTARLWDTAAGTALRTLTGHTNPPCALPCSARTEP